MRAPFSFFPLSCVALTCLLAGGLALGQSPVSTPAGAALAAPGALLGVPRTSTSRGVTRVVFDLPEGVAYTFAPTFTGLLVTVRGVRAALQSSPGGVTPELAGWKYAPTPDGVTVTLSTPFPLAPEAGWKALELPPQDGRARRLVLDLGATLSGGAREMIAAAPPAETAGLPQPDPATADPAATPVGPAPTSPEVPALTEVNPAVDPAALPTPGTPAVPDPAPAPAPAVKPPAAPPRAGVIGTPRIGKSVGATRAVLDLPAGSTYTLLPGPGGLRIELRGPVLSPKLSGSGVSAELTGWHYEPVPGGVSATFLTPFPLSPQGGWRSQILGPSAGTDRPRLVLDFSPGYADTTPLAPSERALAPIAPPLRPVLATIGAAAGAEPAAGAPTVVIDPGHGGKFPGAVGTVVEKVTTLAVAQRVRDLLVAAGVSVIMTRDSDVDLSKNITTDLNARAKLAAPPAQLFVSIHVNSMPPQNAARGYGIETWWYGNNPLSSSLAATLQRSVIKTTSAFSQGLKGGRPLVVLKNAHVPAALVEIGYTSHPIDGQNLLNGNYLDRVALGIAQGIRETLMADR